MIVLAIAVLSVQWIFVNGESETFQRIGMLQKEKPGTMDAVIIGGSEINCSWQPLIGWNQHGIAVWNYSVAACHRSALKYMLIEARKTQPDALYVISITVFKREPTKVSISVAHRHLNFLPFSINKLQLMNRFADISGYTWRDRAELLFPIARFHTRWDKLASLSRNNSGTELKSSTYGASFAQKEDASVSEEYKLYNDAAVPVSNEDLFYIDDLLDYCDQNHVNVLFVKIPQATPEEQQGRMNEIEKLVTGRGYPCLDLLENYDELTLDLQRDFFNKAHMNVHGAMKFSRYLGQYLKEHYGFTDKRGKEGWESWDQAEKAYMNGLSTYVFPFEPGGKRTDLPAPVFTVHKSSRPGEEIRITWDEIDQADGYEVYRRTGDQWKLAGETDQLSYIDRTESGSKYTVVAYRILDGEKLYGHINTQGIALSGK